MKAARWVSLLILPVLVVGLHAQDAKYSVKAVDTAPPKELDPAIQKLLDKQSIQLFDAGGKIIGEYWFRAEIPAEATEEQIKNGLTYREVPQSTIMGAVRFNQDVREYRKQKVKAGVYTLRLAYQPMDGDHAGMSDSQEFLVVLSAAKDKKAEPMDVKEMIETSQKSIGTGHPGVFMLFPNSKPGANPSLEAKAKNHWVVNTKGAVTVAGKKTPAVLGVGLTVIGSAD